MGSVWKRLNRINKRASKYKFTASYQELYLEAGPSWQPSSLSVVWTRRGRRIVAAPVTWEPTMKSPYIGMCVWPVPDMKEILVTLFRDQRQEDYDNKDWFFVLEDVKDGKRKPVAQGRLNLKDFAKQIPHQENLRVKLRPLSKKVSMCYLTFSISSEFIKEGKATDDDMRSVASLVSNSTLQHENDIANLGTLEEETDSEQEEKILVPVSEFEALTKSIQSMNNKLEEPLLNQQQQQQPVLQPQQPFPRQPLSISQQPTPLPRQQPTLVQQQQRQSLPQHRQQQPSVLLQQKQEQEQQQYTLQQAQPSLSPQKPQTLRKVTPPILNPVTILTPRQAPPLGSSNVSPLQKTSTVSSSSTPSCDTNSSRETKFVPAVPPRVPQRKFSVDKTPPSRTLTHISNPIVNANIENTPAAGLSIKANIDTNSSSPAQSLIDKSSSPESSTPRRSNIKTARVDKPHENSSFDEFTIKTTEISGSETIATSTTTTQEGSFMVVDGEVVETKAAVSQEKKVLKIDRTKSQELRDFTKEFVLSTVEDFDPMSFQDFTPTVLRGSMRRTDTNEVSTATEKVVETPAPLDSTVEPKHEILPSDSFLTSLNLEGDSSDTSTPSDVNETPSDGNSNTEASCDETVTTLPESGRSLVNSETFSGPLNSLVSKPTPMKPKAVTPVKTGVGASNDLLEWSKSILSKYPNVKVTNFTTSWRNGLAFCALIHSFYPGLVEYSALNGQDVKHNNKLAFQAGELLGIPRVLEPEAMAIKKIPDKLAVITYLHQLRSTLGSAETTLMYEARMDGGQVQNIRKSFSEGNIKLFTRNGSHDHDKSELPTVFEEGREGEVVAAPFSKYKQKAKDLMEAARRDSLDKSSSISPERENTPPNVILRQKNTTATKPKRDNRLSYIDNEMKFLDAEQMEIDRQAAILDKRLRETSDDDQLVYDALLQQWFTLVNKKNTLLRRQMQLNILEKEDDLEKKFIMLQDELRTYSEMDERRKTEEDCEREELLLQELVMVVNQRNELVLQRDDEERMIENDEQIEQDVTIPEERLVQNKSRDDCKMQ